MGRSFGVTGDWELEDAWESGGEALLLSHRNMPKTQDEAIESYRSNLKASITEHTGPVSSGLQRPKGKDPVRPV